MNTGVTLIRAPGATTKRMPSGATRGIPHETRSRIRSGAPRKISNKTLRGDPTEIPNLREITVKIRRGTFEIPRIFVKFLNKFPVELLEEFPLKLPENFSVNLLEGFPD